MTENHQPLTIRWADLSDSDEEERLPSRKQSEDIKLASRKESINNANIDSNKKPNADIIEKLVKFDDSETPIIIHFFGGIATLKENDVYECFSDINFKKVEEYHVGSFTLEFFDKMEALKFLEYDVIKGNLQLEIRKHKRNVNVNRESKKYRDSKPRLAGKQKNKYGKGRNDKYNNNMPNEEDFEDYYGMTPSKSEKLIFPKKTNEEDEKNNEKDEKNEVDETRKPKFISRNKDNSLKSTPMKKDDNENAIKSNNPFGEAKPIDDKATVLLQKNKSYESPTKQFTINYEEVYEKSPEDYYQDYRKKYATSSKKKIGPKKQQNYEYTPKEDTNVRREYQNKQPKEIIQPKEKNVNLVNIFKFNKKEKFSSFNPFDILDK